jgi:hypothetical protein
MRAKQLSITKSQFIDLQKMYHTDYKIAKVLDLSVSRVCQIRKHYHISIYPIGKENLFRNKFIYKTFRENKITKKELAKRNYLSYKTITRIIQSFEKEKLSNDRK